jgi:Ser/Thr protein kinase RdoA (MazF antagonist)
VPLTESIADEIVQLTGLSGLTDWRDLGGSWSTNIAATSPAGSDSVVFRIHQRFVDHERLVAEQEARLALAALRCPTVPALPIFAGLTIGRLADGNLVEAEPLVPADATMDSPARLIDGFAVLGALHDGLRTSPLPAAASEVIYANHLDVELVAERTTAGVTRIKSWRKPDLTAFADRLQTHLASVEAAEREYLTDQHRQLVHGDFWDNNVLFANGRVAAVLDFGFMAERPRIDDLALPIWYHLLGQPASTEESREQVVRMMDAYDGASHRPLTSTERLQLPLVIARQPAWMVGRWVLFEDDVEQAEMHTRRAATEFATAAGVLDELRDWQEALTG